MAALRLLYLLARLAVRCTEIIIVVPLVVVVTLLSAGPAMAGVMLRRRDYRWYR